MAGQCTKHLQPILKAGEDYIRPHLRPVNYTGKYIINPYPANVDNMANLLPMLANGG